jgi:hypothetical protein
VLGNILSILGVTQNAHYRREDLYLKATALLDEIQANTEVTRSWIAFEVHRLGRICDSKSIARETALKHLMGLLPQCETLLGQVQENRVHLQTKEASKEVVAMLESWKGTSTQIKPYAQSVAAAIEDALSGT